MKNLLSRLAKEWGITVEDVRSWKPCRKIDSIADAIEQATASDCQWALSEAIQRAWNIAPETRAAHLDRLVGLWLYCAIRYATDIDPAVRAEHLDRLVGERLSRAIQGTTDIAPETRAVHLDRLEGEWLYRAIENATDIAPETRDSHRVRLAKEDKKLGTTS